MDKRQGGALSNRPLFAMWGVMPGGARWPAEFVEREHSPVRKERVAEVAEPGGQEQRGRSVKGDRKMQQRILTRRKGRRKENQVPEQQPGRLGECQETLELDFWFSLEEVGRKGGVAGRKRSPAVENAVTLGRTKHVALVCASLPTVGTARRRPCT